MTQQNYTKTRTDVHISKSINKLPFYEMYRVIEMGWGRADGDISDQGLK